MAASSVQPPGFAAARHSWAVTTRDWARFVTSMRDTLPGCCATVQESACFPRLACPSDCSPTLLAMLTLPHLNQEPQCLTSPAESLKPAEKVKNLAWNA